MIGENILKLSVNSSEQHPSGGNNKSGAKESRCRGTILFHNKIMLIFTSVIVLSAVFLISSSIKAEGGSTPEYKYYKSIEVKSGDTLWSIAEKYMADDYPSAEAYIKEVKYINNIGTDHITSGKSIVIPYYSSELH